MVAELLPSFQEQVRRAHGQLIRMVVAACQDPGSSAQLETHLQVATANGWEELVHRLRRILRGDRENSLLLGLDDEDRVIVGSILQGLQDPTLLPEANQSADPRLAAPGIASIVLAVRRGDSQALQWLGQMVQQMERAGGEMARLGACLGPLSRGEVDLTPLERGLGASTRGLLRQIMDELHKLQAQ